MSGKRRGGDQKLAAIEHRGGPSNGFETSGTTVT
jgi:hypothetical protein